MTTVMMAVFSLAKQFGEGGFHLNNEKCRITKMWKNVKCKNEVLQYEVLQNEALQNRSEDSLLRFFFED